MTVDDDSDVAISLHLTILPFRSVRVGAISNLDIRGKILGAEILEKVKLVKLICNPDVPLRVEKSRDTRR